MSSEDTVTKGQVGVEPTRREGGYMERDLQREIKVLFIARYL